MSQHALYCQTRATGVRTAAALSDSKSVNLHLRSTGRNSTEKQHTDALGLSSRDLVTRILAMQIPPHHPFHGRLSNGLVIKHTILTWARNCTKIRNVWASAAVTCTTWMTKLNMLHQRLTALACLPILTVPLRHYNYRSLRILRASSLYRSRVSRNDLSPLWIRMQIGTITLTTRSFPGKEPPFLLFRSLLPNLGLELVCHRFKYRNLMRQPCTRPFKKILNLLPKNFNHPSATRKA